ncbi:MAG: hypothetical protein V4441_01780 [Pseudomonadota bacterium]
MSIVFGSSDELVDHAPHGDVRPSVGFELIYWSAIFASAGITVLCLWTLIDVFL